MRDGQFPALVILCAIGSILAIAALIGAAGSAGWLALSAPSLDALQMRLMWCSFCRG